MYGHLESDEQNVKTEITRVISQIFDEVCKIDDGMFYVKGLLKIALKHG